MRRFAGQTMRCDSTVRYSIYDLFLNEYCEQIRAEEEKRETNKSKAPINRYVYRQIKEQRY